MIHRRAILRILPGNRESGQDIIEYALIAPILFLLLFGIVEFAIVIFSYNTIANAAREGARAGVVPNTSEADIVAATELLMTGLTGATTTVSGAPCTDSAGTIQVVVDYNLNLITGDYLGAGPTIPLRAQATMRCEG